jgi:dsDNA-binding SOS-regulon protein
MKRQYTITLDEDKVDALKIWLDKNGQTFSGYLNTTIGETLQALDDFVVDGNEKISFFKLLSMAGKMTKTLKREMKK